MKIDELVRCVSIFDAGFIPDDVTPLDILKALLDPTGIYKAGLVADGWEPRNLNREYTRQVYVAGHEPDLVTVRVVFDGEDPTWTIGVFVDEAVMDPMPKTMGALRGRLVELNTERAV